MKAACTAVFVISLFLAPSPAMRGSTPSAAANTASLKGFEITATSNYAGTLDCKVCPMGVRVISDKLGMTWILRSPAWSAQVYNTSNKKYVDIPYKEWKNKIGFGPMARHKATLKLAKTEVIKPMFGLNARQYVVTAVVKTPQPTGKIVDVKRTEAEMWVAKDSSVPPQFTELMTRIFAFPHEDGLPLKISCRQRNGKLVMIWDTARLKRSSMAASDFVPLTGYKRVKDEMALMIDEEDLMLGDDLGEGESSAKPGKIK